MKKLSMIQSNYIPWKGYFDLINMADDFVFYDCAQYTKNDWRNRNKIKTSNGVQWIVIPVHHKRFQKINEIRIVDDSWRKKHWPTIAQNYSKATYFKEYKNIFEEIYSNSNQPFLSEINYAFVNTINQILGIKTQLHRINEFNLINGKTERIVDICKQLKADEYISGPAARAYLDESLFTKENIKVTWIDYTGYPEYCQLFPPFEHYVSVLDLIFNEGPNAPNFMKSFKKI